MSKTKETHQQRMDYLKNNNPEAFNEIKEFVDNEPYQNRGCSPLFASIILMLIVGYLVLFKIV